MPPKPDLTSHTLTNFLDKFVYRNAKATASGPKGSSIMQPLSGGDSKSVLLSNKTIQNGSVNTEAFWRKKAEDVAVDEVFFHKYFSQIGKGKHVSSKKNAAKADTVSGDEEDENEDEIWQALVDSRPEVEGGSDDESDMEMLDLDDSDMGSSADDSDDGGVDVEMDDDEDESGLADSGDELIEAGVESDEGSDLDELFTKELQKAQADEEGEDKGEETSRQKKRRLKSLPTFASVDDYAEMLDGDEDEDL